MLYRKPSPSRVMASPSPSHQRTSQRCSVRTCQAGAREGPGRGSERLTTGEGYASRAMLPGRGGAGEGRGEEGRRSEEKRGEGRRGGVRTVVLRPPLLWKDAKSRLPSSNAPTVLARAPDATRGGGEMALTPASSHLRDASPRRRRSRTLPRRHRPCPPPRRPRRCLAPLGRPSGRRRAPQQARLPRGTHIASTGTRSSTSPCAPSGHVLDASTTCPQPRLATSPFRRAPAQATGSARREARPR